jgi:predicted secreted hydrolase
MSRKVSLLTVLLLGLTACAPQALPPANPAANPAALIQAQNAQNRQEPLPASFNEKQYLDLSVKTILEDLDQGSEASLQAYLDWGKSQPEYFKGSRNAIGAQVAQTLRSRSANAGRFAGRVAEIDALLKTPVKGVSPEAYKPIDFNRDQGAHKSKLAEWWYYTGHLQTAEGRPYGYELCYFRVAPVINFAHLAVTDEKNQTFTYERNFYRPSAVNFSSEKNKVGYGPLLSDQVGPFAYTLQFPLGGRFKLNLRMESEKQPLMINGNGLIDMPEGLDSYYYSVTRMKTVGTLEVDGKAFPVTGQSWMDHQWGHFVALRIGWDWFSFQMDDGSEYNLFGFRKRNGEKLERYVNGLDSRSKPIHGEGFKIERLQWWKSPKTGRLYVTRWRVHLPQTGESFEVEAVQADQEVAATKPYDIAPTYWEGRCKITKIRPDGSRVSGMGYTEHFDYTQQIGAD